MHSFDYNNLKVIKADKSILSSIEFDCGDDDLNEFLLVDSFDNLNNSLCTIFLCMYDKSVVGFFSLSADSIKINENLSINYPVYPAVKIGRFAVHKDFQNKHIGSLLVEWITGFCINLREEIGIRFLSVDAYNNERTLKFYERQSFVKFNLKNVEKRHNIPMYLDLCKKI